MIMQGDKHDVICITDKLFSRKSLNRSFDLTLCICFLEKLIPNSCMHCIALKRECRMMGQIFKFWVLSEINTSKPLFTVQLESYFRFERNDR